MTDAQVEAAFHVLDEREFSREAVRAALAAAQAGAPEWKPGGLRCDECDNGIEDAMWEFCPWCGRALRPPAPADDRWKRCPSTHCERWQECRSPNECSVKSLSKEDARTIAKGLLPDGIDVTRLTPEGRQEIRAAIDALLGAPPLSASEPAGAPSKVARCEVTGNPVGTDTWAVDHPCQCAPCQAYLRRTQPPILLTGTHPYGPPLRDK